MVLFYPLKNSKELEIFTLKLLFYVIVFKESSFLSYSIIYDEFSISYIIFNFKLFYTMFSET